AVQGTGYARSPLIRGGLAPGALRRACAYLEKELAGAPAVADAAAIAGLSTHHFSRAFKRSTGLSPHLWLLHRRIELAALAIGTTDLPLAEIALAVGFSSQQHLTTAFRRMTGATPGAWRRARAL